MEEEYMWLFFLCAAIVSFIVSGIELIYWVSNGSMAAAMISIFFLAVGIGNSYAFIEQLLKGIISIFVSILEIGC